MRLNNESALTPALSPGRWSTKGTLVFTKSSAAFVALSDAESQPTNDFAIVALPLPGGEGRGEGEPTSNQIHPSWSLEYSE